jgi:NTP pyrophosphatase (non-canonical NTP hydrolase)
LFEQPSFKLGINIGNPFELVKTMHIREFQEMMRTLHFERDSKRGVKGTHNWLLEELCELEEALEEDDMKGAEREFADVMAWLASLANITGIDLEKAAIEKYDSKCPKCRQSPCQCKD